MSTFKKYMEIIQENNELAYTAFTKMSVSNMNDEAFLKKLKEAIDKLSKTHDNHKEKLDNFYDFIFKNLKLINDSKTNEERKKRSENFKNEIEKKEIERKSGKSEGEKIINEFIFQFLQKTLEYLNSKQ